MIKKILITAFLLAPFVYAYYHKPPMESHQEKIYVEATKGAATFTEEVAALPAWDGLEFVDWSLFTATRDKKLYSLVSFGLYDYVFVVDADWAQNAFKLRKMSN